MLSEEESELIGLWGQRHARHLQEHHKVLYMNLLTSVKLHKYHFWMLIKQGRGYVFSVGKGIC